MLNDIMLVLKIIELSTKDKMNSVLTPKPSTETNS